MLRTLTIGSVVAASLVMPRSAHALGPGPACGDTVTTDVVLTHDLVDCPEVGLVVGADDITIDLGGHTVDGALGEAELGIDDTAGHSGLTVTNGTIRQFVEGVLVVGGEDAHVHHVAFRRLVHSGVYLAGTLHARVNRIRSVDSCAGVVVDGSGFVRVDHNVVLDQSCAGVSTFGAYRVRIAHNEVDGSPGGTSVGDAAGIAVLDGSHGVVVRANSVEGVGYVGLRLEGSDRNRVVGNLVADSHIGLTIIGEHNVVRANTVRHNGVGCADDVVCGAGISYEGGGDNLIEDNVVLGNGHTGIWASTHAPETPPSVATTIRANIVRRSGGDGIRVSHGVRGTDVSDNLVTTSTGDGIDVDDAHTVVAGNRARRNADLGIEGTAGMTDGGGNRAHGNGDPRQCTHVRCA